MGADKDIAIFIIQEILQGSDLATFTPWGTKIIFLIKIPISKEAMAG